VKRKGRKYNTDEVLSVVTPKNTPKKKRVEFDGDLIKITSDRLFVFKQSLVCCECGIIGSFFVKERSQNYGPFHMNLYAIDSGGNEILMTKDHIIPKSLGGKNNLSNYRTMCVRCNLEKGNGT
jgi:hypothetical protein